MQNKAYIYLLISIFKYIARKNKLHIKQMTKINHQKKERWPKHMIIHTFKPTLFNS